MKILKNFKNFKNLKSLKKLKSSSKIIKFFIFSLIFLLSFNKTLFAEELHKMDINVHIRKDGTATFRTILDLTSTKGTEYYIPIENLGGSRIVSFNVGEYLGEDNILYYTFVPNWNIKASMSEKANKNGLIKTQNGYELAFGIGNYGRKVFVLDYQVSHFVKLLNDSDMMFWRFVNDKMSAPPNEVSIKITVEDTKLNEQNAKIWGFGTKGEVRFENGAIVFRSLEPLRSSNYVTLLSRINKGIFIGGDSIDKNFEYYQDTAFKGSSYEKTSFFESILKTIIRILKSGWALFFIVYMLFKSLSKGNKYKNSYKKGELKGEYYRQLPTEKWWELSIQLESAGFVGIEHIFKGFFLKWIQQGALVPITEEEGIIFKKEKTSLKIQENRVEISSSIERDFFEFLIEVSGEDKILQSNEFKRYLKNSTAREKYEEIVDKLELLSEKFSSSNNLLELGKVGNLSRKYNESGREFSGKLVKYYNYLKDFTLLSERELLEIKVWKELLIYATLFGVAQIVEKRLKDLSPEVLRQIREDGEFDHINLGRAMLYSNMYSQSMQSSYENAVRSSSSGSGGFTSIGGGGGSFGGGSGGGSR